MKTYGENFVFGSDADGDMYYRASGALTRLAKGAADYKLFMNAGATAPEWANGVAVLTSTKDISTTGDVALTGAGFKPSAYIIFVAVDSSSKALWGMHSNTGPASGSIYDYDGVSDDGYATGTNLGGLVTSSGNVSTITHKTYDSDGVTITFTETGTVTGTAYIKIFAIR